jgi:hypothetical protein
MVENRPVIFFEPGIENIHFIKCPATVEKDPDDRKRNGPDKKRKIGATHYRY